MYARLRARFGHQRWWPGETAVEMLVGTVLTQNTNWGNVEKVIANLKGAGVLELGKLHGLGPAGIAPLIRPAGYFNLKAKRLHNLLRLVVEKYGGDLAAMRGVPTAAMREELLGVVGIGPETADCILLYVLEKPVFVVDAYTRRILSRHGHLSADASYDAYQTYFHRHLRAEVGLFNDFHAQLVVLAKTHCRAREMRCGECPLGDMACAPKAVSGDRALISPQ